MSEKGALPLQMTFLPESFLVKAKLELNETLENKKSCLYELKKMIEEDDTLNDIDFHSDFLQMFLRQGKYHTNKVFSRLKTFITFRRKNDDYFKAVPFDIAKAEYETAGTPLPYRTPDGCVVVLFEHGNLKCENAHVEDFERLMISVFQQCLRYPMTQINGFICIHDYKNTNIGHVKLATPRRLYLMMQAYFSCLPARYKEIHIINEPFVCKVIMQILKPLMSQKLRKRIFIHSKQEDLLKHLPRHVLPEKYGGCIKDYYQADFIKLACEEQAECTLGGQANFH